MEKRLDIEYPAFVYQKNSLFVANCVLFNLTALGKDELQAVKNLQNSMQQKLSEFNISIKPIYEEYIKPANAR